MKTLTIAAFLTVLALLTACSSTAPMNGAETSASSAELPPPPVQEVLEQPVEEGPPEFDVPKQ